MKTSVTKIVKFEMAHQLDQCYSEENGTFVCPVCKQEGIKNIFLHCRAKTDVEHISFMERFDAEVTAIIDSMAGDYLQFEINNELQKHIKFLSPLTIADRIRARIKELGLDYRKIMGEKRRGLNNPVHKDPNTRKKISESVTKRWEEGYYADRINGMLGKIGTENPRFNPALHTIQERGQRCFSDFLREFQDISTCACCGSTERKMNIHHIDEDRTNFLPSNLEPLCVPCHGSYHYRLQKRPYATIGKFFTFAASHQLPDHKGLCQYLHGHEWKLGVHIRKRVNKKTGMVLDFGDLKEVVNTHIVSVLDHSFLNEILYNPTAENLVVWIWERLMFDGLLKGIHQIELWEASNSKIIMDQNDMRSILIENEVKEATY